MSHRFDDLLATTVQIRGLPFNNTFSRKSKAVRLSNINVGRMSLESQKSMRLTGSKGLRDFGKSLSLHVEQNHETRTTQFIAMEGKIA